MKYLTVLFFSLFTFMTVQVNAQTYKINKTVYNYKEYIPQEGDKYNPTIAGVSSFVVPGLGQMLSGETTRGLYFMGGAVASIGMVLIANSLADDISFGDLFSKQSEGKLKGAFFLLYGGLLSYLVIDIWSIIDAVKVAKVNNMYYQNTRGTNNMSLRLNPYVGTNTYLGKVSHEVGLSLNLVF